MDHFFKAHCLALQEREYAQVFRLLRRALAKKPRLLLTKSIAATKRKPLAPKRPVLITPSAIPSDRELLGAISDACARGWISGTAALEAQRLVEQGKKLPADVRRVILGKGR